MHTIQLGGKELLGADDLGFSNSCFEAETPDSWEGFPIQKGLPGLLLEGLPLLSADQGRMIPFMVGTRQQRLCPKVPYKWRDCLGPATQLKESLQGTMGSIGLMTLNVNTHHQREVISRPCGLLLTLVFIAIIRLKHQLGECCCDSITARHKQAWMLTGLHPEAWHEVGGWLLMKMEKYFEENPKKCLR